MRACPCFVIIRTVSAFLRAAWKSQATRQDGRYVRDMRPVVFIIRDGWGVNPRMDGNSVYGARTPVIDQIRARYPHCLLDCCGEAVGLPDGYQGSSEVGHLNMGAGRIVV